MKLRQRKFRLSNVLTTNTKYDRLPVNSDENLGDSVAAPTFTSIIHLFRNKNRQDQTSKVDVARLLNWLSLIVFIIAIILYACAQLESLFLLHQVKHENNSKSQLVFLSGHEAEIATQKVDNENLQQRLKFPNKLPFVKKLLAIERDDSHVHTLLFSENVTRTSRVAKDRIFHTVGAGDVTEPNHPDFGGLRLAPMNNKGFRSYLGNRNDDSEEYDHRFEVNRNDDLSDKPHFFSSHYAFDDDFVRHPTCRRTSWHKVHKPICNTFHEIDLRTKELDHKSADECHYYLSKRFYRDAWAIYSKKAVLKTLRILHPYDYVHMEMIRTDALIMERLTYATNIVRMYGHCGASVIVEAISGNYVVDVVEKNGQQHNLPPHFGPTEKLTLALKMAEAVSQLHGFKDGVIVHGDIQISQFLLDTNRNPILSDFNRAEVMLWNENDKEYCPYRSGPVYGNVRSPEEYADAYLNEKIDVYSFGNVLFSLLTGENLYEGFADKAVEKTIVAGFPSVIINMTDLNTFADTQMVFIMNICFEKNPDKRMDIFSVVQLLRTAVMNNEQLASNTHGLSLDISGK